MRKFMIVLLALAAASPVFANMSDKHMMGRHMMKCDHERAGEDMFFGMHMLDKLGLKDADREAVESKILETRKEVIRASAEFKVLELELAQILSKQNFDLTAAKEKAAAATAQEAKMRAAHLDCLSFIASKVDKEGWKKLQEAIMEHYGHKGMAGEMKCNMQGGMKGEMMEEMKEHSGKMDMEKK
jgi:hypothetical protein